MTEFLGAGEGELLSYDGGLLTIKATGEQTQGVLLLFEALMPRGKATPLHSEPEAETLFVLEGEIRMHVDGDERTCRAGDIARVRGGTPHAFLVTSDVARLLVMFTPASSVAEAFFRLAGDPTDTPGLPGSYERDPERLRLAAERSGLVILGPPPFSGTDE